MNTLKNHVQLIGNVGQEPTITQLGNGRKVARFSLATNEYYKNNKGEKKQTTQWHTIVAWGKTAEIIEKYAGKAKEIGVSGKLKSHSYEDSVKVIHYVTEVEANEILLLGVKSSNNSAD
ncbi:single-stranded DNA-binding protein [Leeuwenhoekiella sp. A2]|uniref:single-stranded DNA-binding protein n=1 Tax=Leeuwenhoekiella sp. A2 TaxID=3141460 RepID=UPI003A804D46